MVDICIVDTDTSITAGRKEAIPRFEEVAAKKITIIIIIKKENRGEREKRERKSTELK